MMLTDSYTAAVFPDKTPVLCSSGYLFERSEQFDADESEFVASDVLEQEGVVLEVFIGQVVLDLGDQLLDELRIWGLPALLLQFTSTGPRTAVCVCVRGTTTCIVFNADSGMTLKQ